LNGTGVFGLLILFGSSCKYYSYIKNLFDLNKSFSLIIFNFIHFIIQNIRNSFLNEYFIVSNPLLLLDKISLILSSLCNEFYLKRRKYSNYLFLINRIQDKFIRKHKKMIEKIKI